MDFVEMFYTPERPFTGILAVFRKINISLFLKQILDLFYKYVRINYITK